MINSGSEVRVHLAAIGCNGQEILRAHLAAIRCNGLKLVKGKLWFLCACGRKGIPPYLEEQALQSDAKAAHKGAMLYLARLLTVDSG